MTKTRKIAGLILLSAAISLLAACGPRETPEPTPDANMIRTAAVETVAAEMTEIALANPTAAPTDTPTPEPSPTSELPTLAPIGQDGQATATVGLPSITTGTQAAPAAPAGPVASAGDKAQWVSNSPVDGAVLEPGQKFDIKWTVKNVGTTTWNNTYSVRYFAGHKFSDKQIFNFRAETKPDGTTEIIVDAVAPTNSGEYFTWWKLVNAEGVNFGDVDLTIKVVNPNQTAAPTPTVTSTPE